MFARTFFPLQVEKDLSDRKNAKLQSDLEEGQLKFSQLEQKLKEAYEKLQQGETLRRRLHNLVMELKGNIRVFCRMRPLLSSEIGTTTDASGIPDFVSFPGIERKQVELLKPACGFPSDVMNSTILPKGKQKMTFTFDCVFPPNCTQTDVFQEIEPIVQSSLDGYNVCVFAYGQTGSGKTYTMEGPVEDNNCPGMIVLAMHQVFQCSKNLQELGWKHEMRASFLEIYNETINDLLSDKSSKDGNPHLEIKLAADQSSSSIRDSKQHEVTVPGLTIVKVDNVDEVCALINKARKHRAVAATKCNDRSSRSHSVFSMRVKCEHEKNGLAYEGCLNFVDLAGSERIKESGSEGARLEEAKFINKSLSCLGQVFTALYKKEKHIPYRNSRLTYLLQNCLGGNSKTLMFVNISPTEEHFGETVNSLRFATTVNQCHVGAVTRNTL
ncbi:Kinesin domain containing protein [Trichuris trichiura]|uniref:Kinesin domain containing protein n=1 Tax=Trichuris trichiura TaxID=36087 RepID=A0A077Z022_TRITR|nr:Kinesin domain containing protein [Trichuris trichiura]